MAIPIDDAFADLHNHNVREALRRFQPTIMLVAVARNSEIIKTEKLKKAPDVEDLHRFGEDCKGTSVFIANTENFATLEQFRQTVMENGEAIRSRLEHDSP
jgi:hypothetical protein